MEGEFKHLGHVEVAGEVVVLLSKSTHLDAAARTAVARIGDLLAHADQFLNDQVAVKDRWLSESGADDACGTPDEPVRVLLAHLDR